MGPPRGTRLDLACLAAARLTGNGSQAQDKRTFSSPNTVACKMSSQIKFSWAQIPLVPSSVPNGVWGRGLVGSRTKYITRE